MCSAKTATPAPEPSSREGRIRFLERLFYGPGPDAEREEVEAALEAGRQMLAREESAAAWRQWWAPLAAFEGCWLEQLVSIENAHTELGAALLDLQRTFFLQGRRLTRQVHSLPPPEDSRFEDDIHWLQALRECGGRMVPAVLGVTLAHGELEVGMFALERPADYCGTLRLARKIVDQWPPPSDERKLVMSARRYYRRRTLAWCRHWLAGNSLPQRILALLRSKAKYGAGYHGSIEVAGRCLDEWLRELQEGRGEEFLRHFAESPYVDRECPQNSRFLTHAIAFGGPMFGVFSASERALLLQWFGEAANFRDAFAASPLSPRRMYESEPRQGGHLSGRREPLPGDSTAAVQAADALESNTRPRPQRFIPGRLKAPQLYHQLVNGSDSAHLKAEAHRYVDRILGRARWFRKGFFAYSRDDFHTYVDRLHANATRQSLRPSRWSLSRDAFLWGIEQFAPTILVDGAWLQRSLPVARWVPEVGQPLWRIWRDELGDGHGNRHHGNIYRRLMESVGLELPPFDSEAFIRHPGFVAGAFDLPAYLLAIGRSPDSYLPEILGLNLAIELSGLGGTYQRLAAGMEKLGLDSTIVRLHQSIDNLACGHAALARDAIVAYLSRFEPGGDAAVQGQWRRIWSGWQSLLPASWRFSGHLLGGWSLRFAWKALLREEGT